MVMGTVPILGFGDTPRKGFSHSDCDQIHFAVAFRQRGMVQCPTLEAIATRWERRSDEPARPDSAKDPAQ